MMLAVLVHHSRLCPHRGSSHMPQVTCRTPNRPARGTLRPVALTPGAVRPDDVIAARKLLRDVISETPVVHSRVLSEAIGGPVYLKCENLQRTGSFKVRGAFFRIARLSDAERARGVVA